MMGMEPDAAERAAVVERYARFADEAAGRSAIYQEWAEGIVRDPSIQDVIARLPPTRRQAPLVFAVARMLGAPTTAYPAFARWVHAHADDLVAETSVRSLQTNEPLRCAALLPALAAVSGPIALLEVGASAGLCLYPDRYAYRYRGSIDVDLDPEPAPDAAVCVLPCAVAGPMPRPHLPDIVWRGGIDLAPLDAAAPRDRAFLTGLVWPGETGRVDRIETALAIAAAHPPLLVRGDATDPDVLCGLAASAPSDATLVVSTPGVLPHIPRAGRERLIRTIRELGVVWVSIEPAGMLAHETVGAGFTLSRDGVVLAACDPLGAWLEWRTG